MQATPLVMGLFAGLTIFLGLPFVFLFRSEKRRGFFIAVSTGILIYLFVEICAKLIDELEDLLSSAMADYPTWWDFGLYCFIFITGLALGLLGLVYFEKNFIKQGKDELLPLNRGRRVALLIAVSIGLRNFSEGLAIGAEYSWGETRFAWLLALGFGLHNMTEGFGIAAPMTGGYLKISYLILLGFIGGLPTFLGSVAGTLFISKPLEVFFLSLAAGTILYIVGELLHMGRRLKGETDVATGLLVGFLVAFATEMLVVSQGGSL